MISMSIYMYYGPGPFIFAGVTVDVAAFLHLMRTCYPAFTWTDFGNGVRTICECICKSLCSCLSGCRDQLQSCCRERCGSASPHAVHRQEYEPLFGDHHFLRPTSPTFTPHYPAPASRIAAVGAAVQPPLQVVHADRLNFMCSQRSPEAGAFDPQAGQLVAQYAGIRAVDMVSESQLAANMEMFRSCPCDESESMQPEPAEWHLREPEVADDPVVEFTSMSQVMLGMPAPSNSYATTALPRIEPAYGYPSGAFASQYNSGGGSTENLYCEVCAIWTNSEVSMQDHLRGRKHMNRTQNLAYQPASSAWGYGGVQSDHWYASAAAEDSAEYFRDGRSVRNPRGHRPARNRGRGRRDRRRGRQQRYRPWDAQV